MKYEMEIKDEAITALRRLLGKSAEKLVIACISCNRISPGTLKSLGVAQTSIVCVLEATECYLS
jgi:hypothetical protein